MANMKPPDGEAVILIGVGSVSICVLSVEVIDERSRVCIPLLEKRMKIITMRPRETNPPVTVVN
jgi:actin-like ATPase involved in cell morphogenesis